MKRSQQELLQLLIEQCLYPQIPQGNWRNWGRVIHWRRRICPRVTNIMIYLGNRVNYCFHSAATRGFIAQIVDGFEGWLGSSEDMNSSGSSDTKISADKEDPMPDDGKFVRKFWIRQPGRQHNGQERMEVWCRGDREDCWQIGMTWHGYCCSGLHCKRDIEGGNSCTGN